MRKKLFVTAVIVAVVAFGLSYYCYNQSRPAFQKSSEMIWNQVTIKANYKTFDQALSLAGVEKLVIQAATANIVLEGSSNEKGSVNLTTGTDLKGIFRATRKDKTLTLQLKELHPYADSTLTIRVPNSVKSIEISSAAGNLSLEKLELSRIKISSRHGDLILKQVKAKDADLQTTHGDISAEAELDRLQAKTVQGDIHLSTQQTQPHYLLETVSGNIEIKLPNEAQVELDLKTVNGEVNRGDFEKNTGNEPKGNITAKSVNGDIRLQH